MRRVRVGVVGIGFIGLAHVEAIRRTNNAEVIAICDEEGVVEQKGALLGVSKCYNDYSKMIRESGIECVHICTPNYLHFPMAKAALEAGIHVFCEKPLATNKNEALELMRLAQEKSLVNITNFNCRFYPLVYQLKSAINHGDLGEIYSVRGSFLQDWLFYETDYNWRLEPKLSGNSRVCADIGSHTFDLIEFCTGLDVVEVIADFATFHKTRKKPIKPVETFSNKLMDASDYVDVAINTEDYATVMARMSNGAKCVVTASQVFAGKKCALAIEVAGSKKSAMWDSERANELVLGRRDGPNELYIKDPSLMYPEARNITDFPGGHLEGFPDILKQLCNKVYNKILGLNDPTDFPLPDFGSGARSMVLLEKIIESNEKGMWVKIKED